MQRKNIIYYSILAALFVALLVGFLANFSFKYFIWISGGIALMVWSKKDFTGEPWFERKLKPTAKSTFLYDNRPPSSISPPEIFTEDVKHAWEKMASMLCCDEYSIKLNTFFDSLTDNDDDGYDFLHLIAEYCDENSISFIMTMDWKADVGDLEWRISSALKENYEVEITLPNPSDYSELSISCDGVFEAYGEAVGKYDFKLGWIDTESDEYVLIVMRADDEVALSEACRGIGYRLDIV